MRSKILIIFPLILIFFYARLIAQSNKGIVSGPMLAQVEMRTARIWLEVSNYTREVAVKYWEKTNPSTSRTKFFSRPTGGDFKPVQIEIGGLEINTTYNYIILLNGMETKVGGQFTTKDLWQYRKHVPDFSFLAGSCAFLNEPEYDRLFTDMINLNKPATPYGVDSSIFETMAKTPASFMLWLGDNWYTREVDYFSEWGLWYRASRDRRLPVLQNLLKSMSHYAIWDDHDYGPNDADKSYVLKEASRKVFINYWGNGGYGENGQGIYSKMSYADADFFLMDDRYFRSADQMEPLVDGKPNPDKKMWGTLQMEWLKTSLINSKATFKCIVTGSQVLNQSSIYDCLQHYPVEFNELTGFLKQEKINGILFLTGDRHHSEIIKYERASTYNLYDITSSPLTASVARVGEQEKNNPNRVAGTLIEAQNFAKINISGKAKERILKVAFIGLKGKVLGEWSIHEKDLKTPVEN